MSDFTPKIHTLADVEDLIPEERQARIDKAKRKYKQMLEIICSSKDIQAFAQTLSKRKNPCGKCVYRNDVLCMAPYSDGYMEDMGIDPCYEGVLMFLRNEMGDSTTCGEVMKLRHEADEAREAVIVAFEALVSIADIFSMFKGCDMRMQKVISAIVENMRNDAQQILNDTKNDSCERGS